MDRYFISPTASVSIVNGDFIDTPDDGQGESRSSTATVYLYSLHLQAQLTARDQLTLTQIRHALYCVCLCRLR